MHWLPVLTGIDFKVLLVAHDRTRLHTLCFLQFFGAFQIHLEIQITTQIRKIGSTITLPTQGYKRCKLREHLLNNNW